MYYNGLDIDIRNEFTRQKNIENIDALNGDVGYKGKIKGKALIIDWKDSLGKKMKNIANETILVVPQTTPDMVPLLNYCIGIVTDEGGITGHASIISRELKIPCIINTKIATKVFKDNDLIEINTDNKEVRKIYEY